MHTNILIAPVISEKSLMAAQKGWFTFKVVTSTSKPVIAAAVASQFKVDVVSVKTSIVKGTAVRRGRKRLLGQSSDWKKAYVRLKKDQTISLFDVSNEPHTHA